jgi:hypothetical protein
VLHALEQVGIVLQAGLGPHVEPDAIGPLAVVQHVMDVLEQRVQGGGHGSLPAWSIAEVPEIGRCEDLAV